MTTTFTIKQVPEDVAAGLRRRADRNRRSLQRELLLIIERAAAEAVAGDVAAEPSGEYAVHKLVVKDAKRAGGAARVGKLTLEQLWLRARAIGAPMPSESSEIVRHDRDGGHRP